MKLKKYKLGEIAEIIAGQSPESKYYSNNKGVPFLQGNRTFGIKYPDIDVYTLKVTKLAKKGSILISVRAPVGDMNIANQDVCIGRGLCSVNAIDSSNEYLYYNLKNSMSNLAKRSNGTTYDSITTDVLSDYDLYIHDTLYDRNSIASVLSSIDQKIALNRAINDNLEAMAKQLYDYWFVQFDFPNEEGKPYKSSGGKMVWNDKLKREIPKGWTVCNLSDYLHVFTERVPASTVDENTKYAPIDVLPRRKMSFNECASIENAVSGLCAFQKKNILLSNRRVYFHKVCIAAFDGITRDTVIVLKPTSMNLLGYSYQLVNDDVFIEYATRHSYGSEQPVLSWESAKIYKVLKPKSELDVIYSKYASSIIDCVIKNELEIANLTKQRDELLPLLMNGQVSPLNSD